MNLEELSDISAIEQLKSRYFRFMDTKQWAKWRELFTDDMVFYDDSDSVLPDLSEPTVVGGDAFVEYVSGLLRTAVTAHQGHMPDIEVNGDGTAHGVWAMFDWVDDPDNGMGLDTENGMAIQGFGHYHEDYIKGADGRWRIRDMRLTRIRVDQLAPSRPAGARPWSPTWSRAADGAKPG